MWKQTERQNAHSVRYTDMQGEVTLFFSLSWWMRNENETFFIQLGWRDTTLQFKVKSLAAGHWTELFFTKI